MFFAPRDAKALKCICSG